jgi:hypothetical protein
MGAAPLPLQRSESARQYPLSFVPKDLDGASTVVDDDVALQEQDQQ